MRTTLALVASLTLSGCLGMLSGTDEMQVLAKGFEGQLTATIHMDAGDAAESQCFRDQIDILGQGVHAVFAVLVAVRRNHSFTSLANTDTQALKGR